MPQRPLCAYSGVDGALTDWFSQFSLMHYSQCSPSTVDQLDLEPKVAAQCKADNRMFIIRCAVYEVSL